MSYLIVNVSTEKPYKHKSSYSPAMYETLRTAKMMRTKLNKECGDTPLWVVMTPDEFRDVYPVKMVKRVNLMTGLEYEEAEDTPCFMSPSCESYWSM